MKDLTGCVCLVTGATRGIGKGIAVSLGKSGATVYLTGRTSVPLNGGIGGSLQETSDIINNFGGVGIINSLPVFFSLHKSDTIVFCTKLLY